MHWLDVVIIIILVIPMFIGLRRGVIGIIVPLVGIILGIMVAGRFYNSVADWFHPNWLESQAQANIVAFLIIFILFMAAVLVVSSVLRRFFTLFLLGWFDKVGGLILGLVIGGVISGAILSLISKFFASSVEETVAESTLAAFFLDKFPFVLYLLPKDFDTVRQFFS